MWPLQKGERDIGCTVNVEDVWVSKGQSLDKLRLDQIRYSVASYKLALLGFDDRDDYVTYSLYFHEKVTQSVTKY